MKNVTLVCLAALLLIVQPALALQTKNESFVPQSVVDMGDIGKQRFNLEQNGSLGPGDLAWFKFKVVDPIKFFITILNPDQRYISSYSSSYYSSDSSMSFVIAIYDKDMNYIASAHRIVMVNLKPGSYYARLDARPYVDINYTILASNNIESEPNDGLIEANDIGTISGRLIFGGETEPAGDTDFMKFKLVQAGMLRISCTEDHSLVLYRYNDSEKLYKPESSGEGYVREFVSPGLYCLREEHYGDQSINGSYALNFSLPPIKCDKEPNDNFSQAIPMGALNASNESASLVEKGCITPSNGIDFFNFTVPKNMSVNINADTGGEINMCLYDSTKKKLDCSDDYYSGLNANLTPGNYYVKVEGLRSGVAYELTVSGSEKAK